MAGTTQYKNDWQKAKLDRISLTVPKGQKKLIQDHASVHGESVNGFINRAISETMDRDQIFEQNRDEIVSLAKKCRIDIDIDDSEFRKIAEALAILEPHIPGIKSTYFSRLSPKPHPPNIIIVNDD